MEISGEINTIIFRNQVNSYTVAEIEDEQGNDVTVVGYMPFVNVGDQLKFVGKFEKHRQYGVQFKVETFKKELPKTLKALENYLAKGDIKGVGKKTAKRIVKNFGDDTIYVFQNEPERLAEIKGISPEKAKSISESFNENWGVWQIVNLLDEYGIGVENAQKIYELFGSDAIQEIRANPYILVDISRNADFMQIDKAAINMGMDYDTDVRIESGIKYILNRYIYSGGHSCMEKGNLVENAIQMLNVSEENIEDSLINLNAKESIKIEKREDVKYIYLYNYYKIEMEIASRIIGLRNAKNNKKIKDFDKKLKEIEKNSNIELSKKQKEALEFVNNNNVTIITGGPGTGKTTVIKNIIELYEENKKKVVLAAPTGRAAKRMTETTGKKASTLHRLLEIGKIDDNYNFEGGGKGEPIDADVIIVDEVSMVDMFLMDFLLNSIYKTTKLVLVGDADQLASVGPGNILKDLINSEKFATIRLDKIFRQAAKSKIILNAHRVNNGEQFLSKEETSEDAEDDFFVIRENSQENMLNQLVSLCTGRLQRYGNYDFFQNIQVLSPTKKGMLGTRNLNRVLQQELNPNLFGEREKTYNGAIYRKNDRVMQIKNNYDIEWVRAENTEEEYTGTGIFNGEIGTISDVTSSEVEVYFDDDKVSRYEYSELEQIEHSYAVTIHKAQGSEFDVVIMVLPKTSPMLLTRNLLYTGITRAKKLLIIISDKNVIEYMIQNVDSKKRITGLEYKLKNYEA